MSIDRLSNEESTYLSHNLSAALSTWQLDPEPEGLGPEVTRLIQAERTVPVRIGEDLSLRPKIIDACGLTCTFCHNEGTPVAVDAGVTSVVINGTKRLSGRVSVFAATNGVDFVPGRMNPDANFQDALTALNTSLGLNEMHMTGGEPSLHPQLAKLIELSRNTGFGVRMTSNGERGRAHMAEYASAGLEKINFSIFGTTPAELAAVQHPKYQDTELATKKIDALHNAIQGAIEAGIEAHANIVVSDDSHTERVVRVIEEFESRLVVRLLPDLDRGVESYYAIYNLLASLGASAVDALVEAGSSNARIKYRLPGNREIFFKQIRPTRLDSCQDCHMNNDEDCKEGYYGTRLYVDNQGDYKVGVCIQRMDLTTPVKEFVGSKLAAEVLDLREREYTELQALYNGKK